jgi:predicted nuclease of predicted toxin-antitoxin system
MNKTILLDENLPTQLKKLFPPEFTVFTIKELGWQSKKNGELLEAMTAQNISTLFTSDRNLRFQQNLDKYPIQLIVLFSFDNRLKNLTAKFPIIEKELLRFTDEKVFMIDIR